MRGSDSHFIIRVLETESRESETFIFSSVAARGQPGQTAKWPCQFGGNSGFYVLDPISLPPSPSLADFFREVQSFWYLEILNSPLILHSIGSQLQALSNEYPGLQGPSFSDPWASSYSRLPVTSQPEVDRQFLDKKTPAAS